MGEISLRRSLILVTLRMWLEGLIVNDESEFDQGHERRGVQPGPGLLAMPNAPSVPQCQPTKARPRGC
jgi:hypothetical protein